MQRSGYPLRHVEGPLSLVIVLLLVGLTGCGIAPTSSLDQSIAGPPIQGRAFGGQAPITGSAIYLYAVGTSGYSTSATSLLNTAMPGVHTDANGLGYVPTDASGSFNITSDYKCASSSTQVYLLAFGGNPGLAGTVNNSGIGELLALGSCGNYSATSAVIINELSTVAGVSALNQFMAPGTVNVSTSSTNTAGLSNAFVTAANLVNPLSSTAGTTTPNGLGALPYQEINTLADALSSCVNSSGPTSSACATLFTAATPPNGAAPGDTLQAMLNIARNPSRNVGSLYGLATPNAPFQPTLPAQYNSFTGRYDGQPSDWTLAITYFTGPLENYVFPSLNFLTIDSQANVWATGNGHAYKFSNAGALIYNVSSPTIYTNNFNQVLAVDLNDNLWINDNSYADTEISAAGVLTCASGSNPNYCYIPGNGTNYASIGGRTNYLTSYGGIAVDSGNNIWDGSEGALVEVSQGGYGLQNYVGVGASNPSSVAIDTSGNLWLANYGTSAGSPNSVAEISPAGKPLGTFTGGGLNSPIAIAFDHAGNAWVANEGTYTLTELSPAGVPSANSPISGGGIYFASDVAIDGLNNVWVSSYDTPGLAEFTSSGLAMSPSTGYFSGAGSDTNSVAIDSSGNVWASSFNAATLNEIVGVAGPTITPVALATRNGTIGTRP